MTDLPFDIIVIASHRRPPIITEYLKGIPHKVHWSIDYDRPQIEPSARAKAVHVPAGHGPYRCFRAHQEATALGEKEWMLIFEDDARPNRDDWLEVCCQALREAGEEHHVLSMHGRGIRAAESESGFRHLLRTKHGNVRLFWVQGALVYFIRRAAAETLRTRRWEGFPIDLLLCNDFFFACIMQSPFDHDRRHGSLVETV